MTMTRTISGGINHDGNSEELVTDTTDFFRTSDQLGLYFTARKVASSKASIVFVHGTGEHIDRYAETFQTFAGQGYSCFGFDQRGFGRSEGERGHVNAFSDYVEDLAKFIDEIVVPTSTKPIFVLGHSMGSIVVLNFALKYAAKIQGLLIFSCPLHLVAFSANFGCFLGQLWPSCVLPKLKVPNLIDPQTLSDNSANIQAFINDPYAFNKVSFSWLREFKLARANALTHAQAIKLPILINHGDADEIAALSGATSLLAALGSEDKTLHVYPGLKHELLNHSAERREPVLEQTFAWLRQHPETTQSTSQN